MFTDPEEITQRQVNIHQFNREILTLPVAASQLLPRCHCLIWDFPPVDTGGSWPARSLCYPLVLWPSI